MNREELVDNSPTVKDVVTGSTGNNLQDGTVRGAAIGVGNAIAGLIVLNVSMSTEESVIIMGLVAPVMVLVFAAYDKWLR